MPTLIPSSGSRHRVSRSAPYGRNQTPVHIVGVMQVTVEFVYVYTEPFPAAIHVVLGRLRWIDPDLLRQLVPTRTLECLYATFDIPEEVAILDADALGLVRI